MAASIIETILRDCVPAQGRAQAFYSSLSESLSDQDFLVHFAGAPRKLGRSVPDYTPDQKSALAALTPPLDHLSSGNLGRVLLAISCASPSSLHELLLRGDDFEKAAVLLALPFRSDAEVFHLDAVNVCRCNSLDTYRAIAIANPYPARYFTDAEFNQLALKVTFLGLEFDMISGLQERYNPELGKSMRFLYDERTSAGRTLPDACIQFMKEKNLL